MRADSVKSNGLQVNGRRSLICQEEIIMLLILFSWVVFIALLIARFISDENGGLTVAAVCSFVFTIALTIAAIVNQSTSESQYRYTLNKSYSIYYRLEHTKTDESLIDDISILNNEIMKNRQFVDNPIIGVFFNRKIANMDTVKIG